MRKVAIIAVLLFIFINSFDENWNRKPSSITVPAGAVDYRIQKQDRYMEKKFCESDGGDFLGSGLGCVYDD